VEAKLISQQPSTKKEKQNEVAYQIGPKVHRERPCCAFNRNNDPRRDQTPDLLHDLKDLEHLHGLAGQVLKP
jgi:hypothetical protein